MRSIFALIFLAGGLPANAASIDFEFVPINSFCNCYLFDEGAGPVPLGPVDNINDHAVAWDFFGQEPPEFALNMHVSGDISGVFLGGTFTYDSATGAYSNMDLTAGHKDDFTSTLYSYQTPSSGSNSSALGGTPEGGYVYAESLGLSFAVPLDTIVDGDLIQVEVFQSWTCDLYDYDCAGLQEQTGTAYMVASVTAVPVPAAVWLFGSALAGLGWIKRKQII